ncbi:MAG TPA: hypothetical protein V6C97_27965 [Oculatellaceae cyanobacterium]
MGIVLLDAWRGRTGSTADEFDMNGFNELDNREEAPSVKPVSIAERSRVELLADNENPSRAKEMVETANDGIAPQPPNSDAVRSSHLTIDQEFIAKAPTLNLRSRGLQKCFSREAASETPGSTDEQTDLVIVKKPRLTFGIGLSITMALCWLIGISEPLHVVLAASNINTPYIPHTMGFLDAFFVLLVTVTSYWSFCTLRIANALSYKSKSSRYSHFALTLLTSLMNPAVLGVAMLVPDLVMMSMTSQYLGLHGTLAHLGIHGFLAMIMITVADLYRVSVVTTLPVATAAWTGRTIIRVSEYASMAGTESSGKSQLPGLIVFGCQMLPTLFFMPACISFPAVLNSRIHTSTSYDSTTIEFSILMVLGMLIAALAQAVSFYVLNRLLNGHKVLKRSTNLK